MSVWLCTLYLCCLCIMTMYHGYVSWLCIMAMYLGYVSWLCILAMYHGNLSWLCIMAMYTAIYVSCPCIMVMYHGHVSCPCIMAMYHGYVSRLCITAMYRGYVSRLCNIVFFWYSIAQNASRNDFLPTFFAKVNLPWVSVPNHPAHQLRLCPLSFSCFHPKPGRWPTWLLEIDDF